MRIRGFWKGYTQTSLLDYRGYIEKLISLVLVDSFQLATRSSADPEGGQGVRTPPPTPPPGKPQVIWVSMGKGGKLIGSVARKPYFVAREQERIPDCASAV